MSVRERAEYYHLLREYCERYKKKPFNLFTRKIIYIVGLMMRKYKLEIRSIENIPKGDSAIFVCNHSNSHDMFTVTEVFSKLGLKVSPFAASDDLNVISRVVFDMMNATLIDRLNSDSKKDGEYRMCNGLINGISALIFAESTWNLHPINAMLPLKAGAVETALITGKKIIPTIFEYVEVNHECRKESELYSKCVVSFGEPITVNYSDSIFKQADVIQGKMEEMRHLIWEEFGVKKAIDDIDRDLYMNHLFLKKKSMAGYSYDSKYEASFIRRVNGVCENEFYIDEESRFVPMKFE